jgi:RNA polymerase sigma factor (sigma-70 family)
MPDTSSTELLGVLTRLRAGDRTARDGLHQIAYRHMRRIAGRILAESFARLRHHHDVTSIVHDAWINFDKALDSVTLATEADFFRFMAHKIRQVLLTFAAKARPVAAGPEVSDPADSAADPQGLAQWTEFHEKVSRLPDPQRDIFALHYYLELPQARVAELLNLPPKQVSRLWIAATEHLAETFFDGSPE